MPSSTYTATKNQFLSNVINKIGRNVYSSNAYVNPLKRLKKGFIENASEIEEIYIQRAVGTTYDPDGTDTLKRVKSTITTQYHKQDFEKTYTVSLSDKQVRQAFLSKDGVNTIANKQVEAMLTGVEYDEYVATLSVLNSVATATPASGKKVITAVTDNATAKALVKTIKKDVKAMARRTSNYATVENHCKSDKLILFLNEEYAVDIDVELLATAFNIKSADLTDLTVIEIPTLTDPKIKAVLCDEGAIQIYDTWFSIKPQENAKGGFTNQHLNCDKIMSWSNMYNVATYSIA